MPLSTEQKEVLKERMAKAREAKVAKKVKIAQVMEAKPEPVVEPPKAPVIEPVKAPEQVWSRPRHEPLDQPPTVAETIIPVKTPRKPVKAPTNEEKKTKYAKLVFYQEPGSNKKIKKLTKVLEQSSSEDEEEPVVVQPPPPEPVVDPNARYKKLAKMSRLFFD